MILHLLLASLCVAAEPKAAEREFLRGQLLERRGDAAAALRAYESALKADPSSAVINSDAATLALAQGDGRTALEHARRAVALRPADAASLVLLGRVQWSLGDVAAAQKSFEAALRLKPGSAEATYALAGLLADENHPDKALRLLKRFIASHESQAAQARLELAKLELQLDRVKDAERELKASIAASPEGQELPARYALGEAYEVERDTEAALAQYIALSRLEPENAGLLTHIAELELSKDDWDGARGFLLRAKAVRRDDPEANHWLALDAERRRDWSAAASYVRDSAALEDDPALSLRLSYYLSQAGRTDQAVAALESARRRWPENDQIMYFLALGYDDAGRSREAIVLLRRVVALKPDWRDARYELGMLLERTGDIKDAERQFRVLLGQHPDDASALNYLGYSLADRGLQLEQAESYIGRALALDPSNGAYLDSLGWVHYKLGRSSEAVSDLEKAVAAMPYDPTVWNHLGDARLEAADPHLAWLAWKRSESLGASAGMPAKISRLERGFSSEQLGGYMLEYLRLTQGGVAKMTGLCDLDGAILGHAFSYRCLVTFRAPDDLGVDLLGPLMSPLFHVQLSSGGFAMDPLRLPGLDEAAVSASARAAFGLIRDYLAGRFFDSARTVYKRGWFHGPRVRSALACLTMDRESTRVEKIEPSSSGDVLLLSDFWLVKGRLGPRLLEVRGKGFTLSLRLVDVKFQLEVPSR